MAHFGDTLRQARAQRGVTLREVEENLRINRHYLAALEDEQFDSLPPLIYQKGFVKAYATYLGLDPGRLLELYEDARGHRPDDPPPMTAFETVEMPHHWAPNFAIIAFTLIAGAVVFAWLYSAYFNPSVGPATPTQLLPTVTPVQRDAMFVPSPTPSLPTPTPTPEPQEISQTEPQEVVIAASGSASNAGSAAQTGSVQSTVTAYLITATADLYLEVIADDQVAFSGSLAVGESTDWITGSRFVVYTTSGASTQFMNEQGEAFFVDEDPGERVYELP